LCRCRFPIKYCHPLALIAGADPESRTSHLVADARQRLPFRESCFDLIIDKGCLDAVLNDWDQAQLHQRWGRFANQAQGESEPRTSSSSTHTSDGRVGTKIGAEGFSQRSVKDGAQEEAEHVLRYALHALTPGGHYCLISYEPPGGRKWLMECAADMRHWVSHNIGSREAQDRDMCGNGALFLWKVLVSGFEHKETGNYIYILRKDFVQV
jgi:hypothetical protein